MVHPLAPLTGARDERICNPDHLGPDWAERAAEAAMLRLSRMTDYAVVVLARLAEAEEGAVMTAPGLAASSGLGEPTVAKVLKLLAHAGFVEARRGALGGYRLARPLAAIPLADVIAAIDGPIALTACVDNTSGLCEAEASCPVRGRWDPVNEAIRRALAEISIADLMRPPAARGAGDRLAAE